LATQPAVFEINDDKSKSRLEQLSLFMAKSRGIVILQKSSFTDESGKDVTYYDVVDKQIEEPWRSLGQLKSLAVALALLDGRTSVSDYDLNILQHIVNSSMPAERADALEYFVDHSDVTAKDMSDIVGKSVRTCQRLLKELESLGIITAESGWKVAKHYSLHTDFKFIQPVPIKSIDTSEFMSHFIPKKPVTEFSDDELEGVPDLIKTDLEQYPTMTDMLKQKYLNLANEIGNESKKRGLHTEALSIQDQLWIGKNVQDSS